MRITRLNLERYGHFSDKTLLFRADAPLHVVLSPNEGGKTTALTAIADLLFGVSPSTNYSFQHDNKAIRIGGELLLKDGQTLTFRRRKGNQNTLLDGNDRPLPEDFLARAIGSITRGIFDKEFGLTSTTLRQGGADLLKAGGKLAETLATGSAGLVAVSALREIIAQEADELFTPRRSGSKEFYTALSQYEEADKKLKAAIVTADAMHSAQAAFKEAEDSKKLIESKHQDLSRQRRQLERAVRTRKTIAQIDKLSAESQSLSGLPDVAEPAAQSWLKAVDQLQRTLTELSKLSDQDAQDLVTINDLAVDETLLALGGNIEQLRERLGAIKQAREDLPKRQAELAAATNNLENTARRLGYSELDTLVDQRPSDLELMRAEELANARIAAEIRLGEAEDVLVKTIADLRTFDKTAGSREHLLDPAIFRQRLQAVSHVPTSADRLRREISTCDANERDQLNAAKTLAPQVGSLAEFLALPVPNPTDIERFKKSFLEQNNSRAKAESALTASKQKLTSIAAKIERLERDGAQVTLGNLTDVRRQRDVALDNLGTALDAEATARRSAFDNVVSISKQTDVITDNLLLDKERATQLQTLKDEHEDAGLDLKEAKRQDSQLAEMLAHLDADWRGLWADAGVVPTSPSEMVSWRQRFGVIAHAAEKIKGQRDELATLRQELDDAADAIVALMADYGQPRSKTIAVQILYSEASVWLQALQDDWTKIRENSAKRNAAEKAAEQAESEKHKWTETVENIILRWDETLKAIGLPIGASPLEVRAAVGLWKELAAPKQSYDDLTHRINAMQEDIRVFVQAVDAVNASTALGLHGEAEVILKTLAENLRQAQEAAHKRKLMQQQMEIRSRTRTGLEKTKAALDDLLGDARKIAGAVDIASLKNLIDQLARRFGLQTQLNQLRDVLAESGDGASEEILRQEQGGLDFDVVPGEIERLEVDIGALVGELNEASVNIASAKYSMEELSRGRNAVGLARELQEAAGELERLSWKWIVRAAAERLAGRAIEHYRASVQDPLLTAAGTLFSSATSGSFSGLAVDFDDLDKPDLVAVRKSGEQVPVIGLSEGTRDQLFLSLRLALLSMRTAESLPFIGDDILSSFDDERTGRTLMLLRTFGQTSQVIVFTHHSYVATIARKIVPECEIITM